MHTYWAFVCRLTKLQRTKSRIILIICNQSSGIRFRNLFKNEALIFFLSQIYIPLQSVFVIQRCLYLAIYSPLASYFSFALAIISSSLSVCEFRILCQQSRHTDLILSSRVPFDCAFRFCGIAFVHNSSAIVDLCMKSNFIALIC